MENQIVKSSKELFAQDNVKKKFEEMLGKRANQFMTSVLQIVSQNDMLSKADPYSIYNAACVSATLDLPLNQNLGFAYIIPYNAKQKDGSYKQLAQYQIGYKGFIQLAQRTGLYKTIAATPIYEGQLIAENPLTGFEFDFKQKKSDKIIGYAAYFSLLNGFEKTLYLTNKELESHGKKYSQTFKKGFGLWNDNFESMALKTVLKLLLSKYAPLSVELQKAVITDQSIINDNETLDVDYADNINPSIEQVNDEKEIDRIKEFITNVKSIKQLKEVSDASNLYNLQEQYMLKEEELKASELKLK